MIPTAVVLAFIGVAAWMVVPTVTGTKQADDDEVVVTVSFDPAKRSGMTRPGGTLKDRVKIQVYEVSGKMLFNNFVLQSPFVYVIKVDRKTKYKVWAEQYFGASLRCSVAQKGQRPVFDEKPGPTVVTCDFTGRLA